MALGTVPPNSHLQGWCDCLRIELKQFGIDFSIIQPGGINTEFLEVMSAPKLERASGKAYEKDLNSLNQASKKWNQSLLILK